jgi:hypothetical protein
MSLSFELKKTRPQWLLTVSFSMRCGTGFWVCPDKAGFAVWRERFFGTSEIHLALLSLVAEGSSHDYESMKNLEERDKDFCRTNACTVYPTF